MNYLILIRPFIGAGIGYITNWIAVKMMFRPLKPIKIGKYTLPFTPGIIPRNKKRIAHSIGLAISENLITEDTLNKTLLSENTEKHIKSYLETLFDTNSSFTIENKLLETIPFENYNSSREKIINYVSSNILDTINNKNIGKIISEQITLAVEDKLKNSLIRAFINNALITSLTSNVEERINNYIKENGDKLISDMLNTEINKYTNLPISSIQENLSQNNINLVDIVMNIYKTFITSKTSSLFKILNISKIVEDKINEMDMLELEKLILQVMKKELNTLVNLGALIGFILGLLNLLV